MVTRVVGRANDFDLIFTRKNGDVWEANVPSMPSGEYAVELTATDEAGNVSYKAQALLVIDTTRLCVKLICSDLDTDLRSRYTEQLINTDLECSVVRPKCGSGRM